MLAFIYNENRQPNYCTCDITRNFITQDEIIDKSPLFLSMEALWVK